MCLYLCDIIATTTVEYININTYVFNSTGSIFFRPNACSLAIPELLKVEGVEGGCAEVEGVEIFDV
jgi:hypothetical protein